MAHVLNEKRILCRVDSTGILPELGCITGPIRRCRVTDQQLYALVKGGRIVYELNPKDETQMVRMTKLNMNIRQFEQKASTVTKVEETPVVEEKPVVVEEVVDEPAEVNEDVAAEEIETPVVETKEDGNVVVNPVINNQGKNKNKNKHGNYNPNQKIQTADI